MHNSQCTIHDIDEGRVLIALPLSKSVRARELVLDALAGKVVEIEEENDDIFVLSRALRQCTTNGLELQRKMHNAQCIMHNAQLDEICELDLHHSGTALRFMTAFCAVSDGEFLLSGSERLCERPIKPLVDALILIGANIEYVGREGFAPLRIKGGRLKGGRVRLDASVSSQFASALMLIADKVEGGIEIEYEGDVVSQSYISLTKAVIEKYRSGVRCSGERDWSSATVWYAAMAVLKEGRFLLEGLSLDSCQPDRKIVEVFEKLGVKTTALENGVEIERDGCVVDKLILDCKNMPDAVMYIVVAACLLGVEFEISGVETLRVKESDRIEALMTEMRKCGYFIQCTMHNAQCTIHNSQCTIHNSQCDYLVRIETYNDHRVAMAMAVMGLVRDVEIENPEVVNKSYPTFWEEMRKIK